MSIYVRYGNYTHALDEVGFTSQKTPINQGGLQVGVEEVWSLEGFLQAATQAALITACTLLEAAYSVNQRTIQILLNNGSTIARQMPGFHLLGGTEVISGVSYTSNGMGNNGAEFVNFRTFAVQVRGRYALTTPDPNVMISFTESIAFRGGGPRRRLRENLRGRPRGQTLVQQTIYHATQQGSAIGLLLPPTPPIRRDGSGALWPHALVQAPTITPHSPKRNGSTGAPVYTEHQVDWLAEYESDAPFLGRPSYWR